MERDDVTFFICGVPRDQRLCVNCGTRGTIAACGYPLRGRLEGTTCGKRLCAKCCKHDERFGLVLCPPHQRLASRK